MRVAVIVQARTGSKRFPNKVLADLNGKPVLWHVLSRAKKIQADDFVLAIPEQDRNALTPIAETLDYIVWYGQETDVLARYFNAARAVGADAIVRITGDCPLIDPVECNRVLAEFIRNRVHYHSNVYPRKVPSGLDCEVFTMEALMRANVESDSAYDREHVTPWMQRHYCGEVSSAPFIEKFSVDVPEDLERLRAA